MTKYEIVAKVLDMKPLRNSRNGNPRFELKLLLANGIMTWAKTLIDGAIGYRLSERVLGRTYKFNVHFTSKGNMTLRSYEEVTSND